MAHPCRRWAVKMATRRPIFSVPGFEMRSSRRPLRAPTTASPTSDWRIRHASGVGVYRRISAALFSTNHSNFLYAYAMFRGANKASGVNRAGVPPSLDLCWNPPVPSVVTTAPKAAYQTAEAAAFEANIMKPLREFEGVKSLRTTTDYFRSVNGLWFGSPNKELISAGLVASAGRFDYLKHVCEDQQQLLPSPQALGVVVLRPRDELFKPHLSTEPETNRVTGDLVSGFVESITGTHRPTSKGRGHGAAACAPFTSGIRHFGSTATCLREVCPQFARHPCAGEASTKQLAMLQHRSLLQRGGSCPTRMCLQLLEYGLV